MNHEPFRIILSRVLFFLGVLIGVARSVIAIWDNLEATDYYFSGVKYAAFNGLRCPLIIAPTETGIVTAVFNNSRNEEDTFFYKAEISGKSFSTRIIEDQVTARAHQAQKRQFTVDINDVDLLFFILVKITILPNSIHPSQEAACGTMVANILGLTGSQTSLAMLIISIAGILIGLGLWQQTNRKAIPRITQTLGLVMLLTLLATYMGWWTIATILMVIIILLILISIRFALS